MASNTSNGTVTLNASARYGYGGKQFVARITGRHPKFTFEREFLGRKEGKRGESTSVIVDEPGLYMERDIDSKGRATDNFYIVFSDPVGGVDYVPVDETDAMQLAKMTTAEIDREGREREAMRLDALNTKAAELDPDEIVEAKATYGDVRKGGRYPRREIVAARKARIRQLRDENAPMAPEPIDALEATLIERDIARVERDRARKALRLVLGLDSGGAWSEVTLSDEQRAQIEHALQDVSAEEARAEIRDREGA